MNENLLRRELLIQFEGETDEDGKATTKTKTFKNIRFEAKAHDLATFGLSYASLCQYPHIKSVVAEYTQLGE